ncbi:putative OSM3-like kinesin [Trypanosoma rangeli]|uniref:Putative OSM3-like kinesin n=1 Tax=Trypanosoma rangeli TaxID=5698 RepID=A0A422NJK1_TRYRA|nr:putative OSM3-like kinesin [Trypanosoma rangeli]RNF05637.1 putative OSM3-like kinesin [Trypanosoma rangeli]|eukprot:RNF05637.1 putative OSM3-like kinesin [Trypanosoma rangeli]
MVKKQPGAENIRVVVRCRNLLPYESERGDKALVRLDLATNQVIVHHPIGDADGFTFDAVYNNTYTQRDIFLQEVHPLVEAVLQGYNATVFAYGQSGSGKTHTMTGKLNDPQQWGMMPQVVNYLFNEVKKLTSTTKTFKIRVSYVELYNGKSRDLLTSKQVNLEIKQNMSKNFYVKGAEMPEVTSFDEAIRWFNAGTMRRQTASTDLNDTSSRSHSLFTLQVEQFDFEQDPSSPILLTSKINVVDLAGSEKLSKTNATGETAKEGCNINLSLSALATVIDTIVKGGKHIPYRGSPLTMLLKDSLGGNAKTVMFANIGPSEKNISETISTLRFALRAKQIENKPVKNMDPKDARIQDLLDTIEELKSRLGNVDLNQEDQLRQRIEELEVENSDLRGGGEKNSLELEENIRVLQAQLEGANQISAEKQKEVEKGVDARLLLEWDLQNEVGHGKELRSLAVNFIKRVCQEEQLQEIRRKMPQDGSYNTTDDGWDVKEIDFYLKEFTSMYEAWRQSMYTREDLEKYAQASVSGALAQTQRHLDEVIRARDELLRLRQEDSAKRAAENELLSQLRVDLSTLRDDNTRLREKIERDQERMKAKIAKSKDEYKSLVDELERSKALVTEKEHDIERLKRMLEESGNNALFAASTSGVSPWSGVDERTAIFQKLDEEKRVRKALESRIREVNVSLRRYGVCIADAGEMDDGSQEVAERTNALILAAVTEDDTIDGDLCAKFQQQIRVKQRLTELRHQHQRKLEDMLRKYEFLKTGKTTANGGGGAEGTLHTSFADDATAQQIKELLQRKDEEIERVIQDKEKTCDKIVKKLNKSEIRIKELEATLEEERAQFTEERQELGSENLELQKYNQQLSVELETLRGQLSAVKEEMDSMDRAKSAEIEKWKEDAEKGAERLEEMRFKMAAYSELQKSYDRLQEQLQRTEASLKEKIDSLENTRQMVKWSNSLLATEKQKLEQMEMMVKQQEVEMRRREEYLRSEMMDDINKQVAANNRRLQEQAAQYQELISQEQDKQKTIMKKVKSSRKETQKAAQRYDEMILENEALLSKLEELKVNSMRIFLEKQEAQRELEALRPTRHVGARRL